ncbi:MAG: hypothetical protein V1668_04735 [Patescibacteria group bacterium]
MKKIIAIFSLIMLIGPQAALAASFNPNSILSDNDLVNSKTMTAAQIQKFLDSKGGLGAYQTTDPWGNAKNASQIIYDAAAYWQVNPQYLMVRMQIEQSLVTMASPTQTRLDWATGYGCPDSTGCGTNYKGFFNQVNWAARILTSTELNNSGNPRGYLPHISKLGYSISGWGPGITKTVIDLNGTSTTQVTPANKATAALYTYTPHTYNGNYNIWYYWSQWFSKNYPDGSLLQVQGQSGVYLIQNGKKRPFLSRTTLVSRYDPSRIIQVSDSDLSLYADGLPIKFANFSLVRDLGNNRTYLLDGDQKRYIESTEVFREIGYNPNEILDVQAGELSSYADGPNINMLSVFPTGVLLQSKQTGGVAYVQDGVMHPIMSKEILKNRFANRNIVVVDQATLDQYPRSEPIKFQDGTLATSPGANGIWVISNGMRRGIPSKQAFDALGYKWANIIRTNDTALLTAHPEGDPISISN